MAFDGTLKFDTAIDQTGFKVGLDKLGGIAKMGMAAVTGAITAVTGAITATTGTVAAIGKQALDAYADFEQLAGGVETLFGDAAQTVMDNAAEAFQTAGMSVNEYMETATASAAAMVNSLAGDTQKAAELTNMAVTDMADNINKMGTAAENVQNAYAGFAKGNFTMLDNLKLGYGGTKQEMERLLQKAKELTGVEYSIDSYADIVQAIHAVQENMGITGTTAREASETISGSVAAMRSAWDNLLVGIADDTQDFDKLTNDLVSSTETAAGNILPRVETIAGGIVKLVGSLGNEAVRGLTDALSYAPALIDTGAQLFDALIEGMTSNSGKIIRTGIDIAMTLLSGFGEVSVDLLELGAGLLTSLAEGVEKRLPRIRRVTVQIMQSLSRSLAENLPVMLEAGVNIVETLGGVILENLPLLLDCAVTIIRSLASMLSDPAMLTGLLDAGLSILEMLMQVIGENLGMLIEAAIVIVETIGVYLAEHAPELVTAALELVTAIVTAILENTDGMMDASLSIIMALADALTDPERMKPLLDAAGTLIHQFFEGLGDFGENLGYFVYDLTHELGDKLAAVDWAALGKSILDGIFSGLLGVDFDFYDYLDTFKENWVSGIKDLFGIHSPSRLMRDEVGKYLALGIGEGFTEEMPDVGRDALGAFDRMRSEVDPGAVQALSDSASAFSSLSYVTPPASSQIINNYSSNSYTTHQTSGAAPDAPAPGGDIIIPVNIGGEQLDTIVIKATQIANARSGGVTI